MEIMLEEVFKNFNFPYIFICILCTYLIITAIHKDLHTWIKRIISTVVAVGTGLLFILVWHADHIQILCSFLAQYLMYDYVIKWFLKKVTHKKPTDKDDDFDEEIIA